MKRLCLILIAALAFASLWLLPDSRAQVVGGDFHRVHVGGRGYDALVMRDNPVSYWPLSEPSGTAASDLRGSNAGTFSGGFTLNQPGPIARTNRGAVLLNGSTGKIDVASNASLNVSTVSLEIWFYPTAAPASNTTLIAKGFASSIGPYFIDLVPSGSSGIRFNISISGTDHAAIFGTTPSLNVWHHAVGTADGTSIKLYLDGSLKTTTTDSTLCPTNAQVLGIGYFPNLNRFFTGRCAAAAIYSTALTAEQIRSHYLAGLTGATRDNPDEPIRFAELLENIWHPRKAA